MYNKTNSKEYDCEFCGRIFDHKSNLKYQLENRVCYFSCFTFSDVFRMQEGIH